MPLSTSQANSPSREQTPVEADGIHRRKGSCECPRHGSWRSSQGPEAASETLQQRPLQRAFTAEGTLGLDGQRGPRGPPAGTRADAGRAPATPLRKETGDPCTAPKGSQQGLHCKGGSKKKIEIVFLDSCLGDPSSKLGILLWSRINRRIVRAQNHMNCHLCLALQAPPPPLAVARVRSLGSKLPRHHKLICLALKAGSSICNEATSEIWNKCVESP